MFNLLSQATAIRARMTNIQGLNHLEYAELFSDMESKPRILPSASLLPPDGKVKDPENKIITTGNSWMVVIAARNVFGTLGHLALIDNVLDALSGFQPAGSIKPLAPISWGLLNERIGEEIFLSHVTFSTEQRATIIWDVQKN